MPGRLSILGAWLDPALWKQIDEERRRALRKQTKQRRKRKQPKGAKRPLTSLGEIS